MSSLDGKWRVLVASSEKDALNGKGTYQSIEKIQPYRDDVWLAIEILDEREKEIWEARESLLDGEVPEWLLQLKLF